MAPRKSQLHFYLISSIENLFNARFLVECPTSLLMIIYRTFSISLSVGGLMFNTFIKPAYLQSFISFYENSLFRNCLVNSLGSLNVKIRRGLLNY